MFVLCQGKVAKKPYIMPYTRQKVYSLEELCYYIYNNIYTINEEFFEESLARWLREEADQPVLARKLHVLMQENPNLKDLVVTILCGCDYYQEDEIYELVDILDDINNLPFYKKKKIKADNYLRAGQYTKSLMEYNKLLNGSYAGNFSTEEYGDILHNVGIAHFYASSFAEAENDFREAFVRNNKRESLRQYLWLLLMQEKDKKFEAEAVSYGLNPQEILRVQQKYQEVLGEFSMPAETEGDLDRYKNKVRENFSI